MFLHFFTTSYALCIMCTGTSRAVTGVKLMSLSVVDATRAALETMCVERCRLNLSVGRRASLAAWQAQTNFACAVKAAFFLPLQAPQLLEAAFGCWQEVPYRRDSKPA
jgi:hypothetical protein